MLEKSLGSVDIWISDGRQTIELEQVARGGS